jgi:hypothetical protein
MTGQDYSKLSDAELMALIGQPEQPVARSSQQAPMGPAADAPQIQQPQAPVPVQAQPLPDISQPRPEPQGAPTFEDVAHGVDNRVGAMARGVPILGALADEGNAALAAGISPALEPMLRNAPKLAQVLMGYDPRKEISGAGDFGDRFDAAMNLQRFRDDQFDAANPTESKVLQGIGTVGGSIAAIPALAAGSAALPVEAGLIPRMAVGALEGGLVGGAQGYASGDGGVSDPSRIQGAGQGALVGAAAGTAAPAALAGAGAVWKGTGGKVIDMVRGARRPVAVPKTEAEALAEILKGKPATKTLTNPDGFSEPLDMSADARIARALSEGYNPKKPFYHGSPDDIQSFDPNLTKRGNYGRGVYTTRMKDSASAYAGNEGAVYPLALKAERTLDITTPEGRAIYDAMKGDEDALRKSYDLIRAPGETVVLNGPAARSVFDPFNPGGEARVGVPRPGDFSVKGLPSAPTAPPVSSAERDLAEILASRQQVPVTSVPASAEDDAYLRIARSMTRQRQTPEQLGEVVSGLGPRGMVADSGDAMRNLLRDATNRPSGAEDIARKALNLRQQGQLEGGEFTIRPSSGRIMDQAAEGLGVPGKQYYDEIETQLTARKAAADPAYAKMREAAPVDAKELNAFSAAPIFKDAYNRAKAISEKEFVTVPGVEGEVIMPLPDKVPDFLDWRTLDLMKQGLDDLVKEAKVEGIGANSQGATKGFLKRFVNRLDELNPDYKVARDAFAGPTAMKDAVEAGRSVFSEDAPVVSKAIADLTESEREMYRVGALQGLKDKLGNTDVTYDAARKAGILKPNQLELFKELFPSREKFAEFADMLVKEQTMFQTKGAVLGNSSTAKQLLQAADNDESPVETLVQGGLDAKTGNVMGLVRALGRIGGPAKMSEPTSEALASILTNMDQAGLPKVIERLTEAQKRQLLAEALRGGTATAAQSGAVNATQGNR